MSGERRDTTRSRGRGVLVTTFEDRLHVRALDDESETLLMEGQRSSPAHAEGVQGDDEHGLDRLVGEGVRGVREWEFSPQGQVRQERHRGIVGTETADTLRTGSRDAPASGKEPSGQEAAAP